MCDQLLTPKQYKKGLDPSMGPGCEQGLHVGTSCAGCWKQDLLGLAKVSYEHRRNLYSYVYETYMQLRAAKSLCTNFCSAR